MGRRKNRHFELLYVMMVAFAFVKFRRRGRNECKKKKNWNDDGRRATVCGLNGTLRYFAPSATAEDPYEVMYLARLTLKKGILAFFLLLGLLINGFPSPLAAGACRGRGRHLKNLCYLTFMNLSIIKLNSSVISLILNCRPGTPGRQSPFSLLILKLALWHGEKPWLVGPAGV